MSKETMRQAASLLGRKGYARGIAIRPKSDLSSWGKRGYSALKNSTTEEQRQEWRRLGAKVRWSKARAKK